MKRWVRPISIDGNVVYEAKSYLVRLLLFFLPVRWDIGWIFWASARDAQYLIEREIHEHHMKMKELLQERLSILDQVNADLADYKSQPKDRRGRGLPFLMDVKTLRDMPRTEQGKAPEDWKQFINPALKLKYNVDGKSAGAGKKASDGQPDFINTRTPQPGVTAYTVEGMASKNLNFRGADTVMEFREEKKGSAATNDRKTLRKQIVSENPRDDGETEGEYNKRIDKLLREQAQDR